MNAVLALAAALLVLMGQAAPALHLALDARHGHHECCPHEGDSEHWCTCQDPDHHEPCAGCESFTLQAADAPAPVQAVSEPASIPAESGIAYVNVAGPSGSPPSARAPPVR